GAAVEGIGELAVRMGLPKMTARVLVHLLLSEDGRRTAAELTRELRVSPASVSTAVTYLIRQGLIRRERDPRRRRDVYVVDDDTWYVSIVTGARQSLDAALRAGEAAAAYGPDSAVGRRLARGGAFLEKVSRDLLDSAERWRAEIL
ncbi:MAG: MarR family transcriptional regulator, partial [Nonomuraea sp.]|nr:MarR family transcriptional regulator [Nonomuraea sp.]